MLSTLQVLTKRSLQTARRVAGLLHSRGLDLEVARTVFGSIILPHRRCLACRNESFAISECPLEPARYSTDAEAARWVVDRLGALGFQVLLECRVDWRGREKWRVEIGSIVEEDKIAAPAICRAALRALSRSAGLTVSRN